MTSTGPLPFPTQVVANITYPSTYLVRSAFSYIQVHLPIPVRNHVIRASLFALLLLQKLAPFPAPFSSVEVDAETLVLASMMHDLGWSNDTSLVSADKRFEIDGANAARAFIEAHTKGHDDRHSHAKEENDEGDGWDEAHLQSLWYAIALHTTRSISLHSAPLAMLTSLGTLADFLGPDLPYPPDYANPGSQLITPSEFTEILHAYPRIDFAHEFRGIIIGLCVNKPNTTFDNFANEWGRTYVDGYQQEWEGYSSMRSLEGGLNATKKYE